MLVIRISRNNANRCRFSHIIIARGSLFGPSADSLLKRTFNGRLVAVSDGKPLGVIRNVGAACKCELLRATGRRV